MPRGRISETKKLSAPEKAKLVLLFERQGRNYEAFRLAARREFGLRDRNLPASISIKEWIEQFEETGSLDRRPYHRENPVRNELVCETVDYFLEENPQLSQRRLTNELGISRTTLRRVMKELDYHPYKLQLTHALEPEDYGARLEFCLSQLSIISDEPEFPGRILFTDEAHFHLDGGVNRHNCRYWAKENPHWVQEEPLHSPYLRVWAGICAEGIIGPFFFEENVKGENYAQMIEEFALPALEELFAGNENALEQMVWMQDGATPHFGGLPLLDEHFPGRWMGRGTRRFPAPYPWPARSPDLTAADFFLGGT